MPVLQASRWVPRSPWKPWLVVLVPAVVLTAPIWGMLLAVRSCAGEFELDLSELLSAVMDRVGAYDGGMAFVDRLATDEPPERVFRPGEEGHLPGLGARSRQFHYHVARLDRTAIAVRIGLGGIEGLALRGTYPGPARAVGVAEVAPIPLPALLAVAGEPGAPRPKLAYGDDTPVLDLSALLETVPPEGVWPLPPLGAYPWGIPDARGRTCYTILPGQWKLVLPDGSERWIAPGPLDELDVEPDGHGGWSVAVRVRAGREVPDDQQDRARR